MDLFTNINNLLPEPFSIKHIILLLFVLVILGVKLSDILEARSQRRS